MILIKTVFKNKLGYNKYLGNMEYYMNIIERHAIVNQFKNIFVTEWNAFSTIIVSCQKIFSRNSTNGPLSVSAT